MRIRVHSALIALAFVPVLLMACGDGGVTNPAPVAVSVSPSTVSLAAGESAQFTATVTGTSETGVTWTASAGAVSGSGNTVTYTAPTTAGTHSLKATSIADPTRSASASITVVAANVLVNRVPVPASGGSVVVDRPESPLHGMRVELTAGTYGGTTHWTVIEDGGTTLNLPPGLTRVGPAFRIRNEQAYGNRPFTITIPVPEESRSNTVAFYHDPGSGTFELIPLLGTDDTGIVVATRHVSADQLLIPGQASGLAIAAFGSSAAADGSLPFGEVEIVLVEVDEDLLASPLTTTFVPGVNDWEFANLGSALEPLGFCTGSTLTALYRHYMENGLRLFGFYDRFPDFWADNPDGIRLASVAQHTIEWESIERELATLTQAAEFTGLGKPRTQILSLAASMRLTGLPQQLAVYAEGRMFGHAIIAYGMDADGVLVADPNAPGVPREMRHSGDEWIPLPFMQNATASAERNYVEAFVVGVSAYFPLGRLGDQWARFRDGSVGDDLFPEVRLEYRDPVDTLGVWHPLPQTIETTSDSIFIRGSCAEKCDKSAFRPDDWARIGIINAADGTNLGVSAVDDHLSGVAVKAESEAAEIGVISFLQRVPDEGLELTSFVDLGWYTIERVDFTLTADPTEVEAGDSVTFTVDDGGLLTAGRRLRWDFGDGSEVIEGSDPEVEHVYEEEGTYVAVVKLLNANGALLAVDSLALNVGGIRAWRGDTSTKTTLIGLSGIHPLLYELSRLPLKAKDAFFISVPGAGMEQIALVVVADGTGSTLRDPPSLAGDHQLAWVVATAPAGSLLSARGPIQGAGTLHYKGVPLSYTFMATFEDGKMRGTLTADHAARDEWGNPFFRITDWTIQALPFTPPPPDPPEEGGVSEPTP